MNKERYSHKLEVIREAGNYRTLREVEHNGFLIHCDGRETLNLSSNDYLGLASNPALREEFQQETDVRSLGYSASSSRLLSGNHEHYGLLERDLREMYGREAALVLASGYHANIGILPALAGVILVLAVAALSDLINVYVPVFVAVFIIVDILFLYYCTLMFVAYFDLTGEERADLRKKF